MSPRKRKLLKFGLLIGLPFLLVLGFWPYPEPPELPVRSYFLGFTNMFPGSQMGVGAQFFLINYPANERELPVAREFACLEDGVWKPWLPALTSSWPMMVTHDNRIHPNVIFNLTVPHTNGPWRAVLEFPAERLQPSTLLQRAWAWLTSKAPPPPPTVWTTTMNTPTGQVRMVGRSASPQPPPPPRHRSLFFTNDTTGGPVAPPALQMGEINGLRRPSTYGARLPK